jgi:hypothetical protein
VLAAAEGRVADAASARTVSNALMARLGLVHWHMYEGARVAALGTGPEPVPADPHADLGDTDPWGLLYATLNMPVLASGSRTTAADPA